MNTALAILLGVVAVCVAAVGVATEQAFGPLLILLVIAMFAHSRSGA